MDKETLSNYGWIVILVLILAVMIALAGPFGNFIAGAIKSTTAGLFEVNQNALNNTGLITIPDQEFDGTGTNDDANNESADNFVPGLYQTGAIVKYENGEDISAMLIKTWDELVAEKAVNVLNGTVYTIGDWYSGNESSDALAGDLLLPNDGTIKTLGTYDEELGGRYAFQGCKKLTGVVIPNSINGIILERTGEPEIDFLYAQAGQPFAGCESLTNIVVEEGNDYLYAENNCLILKGYNVIISGFSNSTIPTDGSVTTIGMLAFAGQTNLDTISIPETITCIGGNAFRRCTSLKEVTLPSSLTDTDGEQLFAGCTSLETATFLGGITKLEDAMFWDCTALKSVYIPVSVKDIMPDAFDNCPNLTDVYYQGNQEEWEQVHIYYNNTVVQNATIHYNSTK